MTPLRVIEERRVSIPHPLQPPLPRATVCVRPGCYRPPAHQHHIIARSARGIKGGVPWVHIDAVLVYNLADLCATCHHEVEDAVGGHKARIRYVDGVGWAWYYRATEEDTATRIYWVDPKSQSVWYMAGFLKGDYWFGSTTGE